MDQFYLSTIGSAYFRGVWWYSLIKVPASTSLQLEVLSLSVSLRYQLVRRYDVSNWLVLSTYQWDIAKTSQIVRLLQVAIATSWRRVSMVCDVPTYMRPKWDVATTLHARWDIFYFIKSPYSWHWISLRNMLTYFCCWRIFWITCTSIYFFN